jgi:hypothetical protein
MSISRRTCGFVLGVVLSSCTAVTAEAATCTYTGNDYTSVCIVPIAGGCNTGSPYTTSDSITGEIALTSPLAGNLAAFAVSNISSYSFNDGIGTMWNPTDSTVNTFQVGTNSQGDITTWELLLVSSGGSFKGFVLVTCGGTGFTISQCSPRPEDFADISLPAPNSFTFGANNNPGTWSATAASTAPEPSSFGLAMLGALLFVGRTVACERKRRPTRAETMVAPLQRG